MKRIGMAGLLGAVGIATAGLMSGSLAGAASNQTTFESGYCTVHGSATFNPPLKNPPAPGSPAAPDTTYNFKTTGDTSVCHGSLNGRAAQDYKVTAYVKGTGQLSCSNSTATGGKGAVVFADGGKSYTIPLNLDVKGALTEVDLDVYDNENPANHAPGHASFAAGAGSDTVTGCGGPGVPKLDFDAQFAGSKLVGPAPTASSSTSTNTSTQTTAQPTQTTPTDTTQQTTQQQTPSQGAVKGERKSSKKKSRGLKCGKGHKKHTKAQGKRCTQRGKGKKKGHGK